MKCTNINSCNLSLLFIQFRVTKELEPIPATIGREVGYTLTTLLQG